MADNNSNTKQGSHRQNKGGHQFGTHGAKGVSSAFRNLCFKLETSKKHPSQVSFESMDFCHKHRMPPISELLSSVSVLLSGANIESIYKTQ